MQHRERESVSGCSGIRAKRIDSDMQSRSKEERGEVQPFRIFELFIGTQVPYLVTIFLGGQEFAAHESRRREVVVVAIPP